MTEPQVWVLIGVFASAMFASISLIVTSLNRTLRAEIGAVRTEIGAVRIEISGVRESMELRFNALDRDVQWLMNREFGSDRG